MIYTFKGNQKMKKILAFVAGATMTIVTWAAPQTVQMVWPFNPGSAQAVMFRHVIDTANQSQQKYQFVFANKPGGGGTVAAQAVLAEKNLTVLISTSSFYVRPMMYTESHDIGRFSLISSVCENTPIGIFSRRYRTLAEARAVPLTVGVLPGSITELVTDTMRKNNPGLQITPVPYKGTPEATTDMMGGHIDASLDFLDAAVMSRLTADVSVIGVTGAKSFPNAPSFSSLEVKGLDNLTNSYYAFVPATTDSSVKQELAVIFFKSMPPVVKQLCDEHKGSVGKTPVDQLDQLHKNNIKTWQQLTQGIVLR